MYIDVNSIVKEENLIYFTEKHVPKNCKCEWYECWGT